MKSITLFNKFAFIAIFSFLSWVLFTNMTSAFGPTHTMMVKVNDTHTAYAINYKFNFMNRGVLAPALAHRASTTWSTTTKIPPLTYTLRDKDGQPVISGRTVDSIFSRSSSTNNIFKLNEGESGEYTLVVLHEHTKDNTATHMTIDQLPFILINDGIEGEVSTYPDSSMEKYTTKSNTKSSYILYPINK